LLGIPKVGAGAFRHYIEKYVRAKDYCLNPFETRFRSGKKAVVPIIGERIQASLVKCFPSQDRRDGVFTDPPYYDNVQYAELMDFCYVWLRKALNPEFPAFGPRSTRTSGELTGNITLERGIASFTQGLSSIYQRYAAALKPGAPFVFTYHHNDLQAYVPVVVAILDAGLDCTFTFPAPAEMRASLHIAHSKSSVLDSVFVCRMAGAARDEKMLDERLQADVRSLMDAGLVISDGDLRCLTAGHVARLAVNKLRRTWDNTYPLNKRITIAEKSLFEISVEVQLSQLVQKIRNEAEQPRRTSVASF
jgi:hypothetical protein